jgi:hypothetical protein
MADMGITDMGITDMAWGKEGIGNEHTLAIDSTLIE